MADSVDGALSPPLSQNPPRNSVQIETRIFFYSHRRVVSTVCSLFEQLSRFRFCQHCWRRSLHDLETRARFH
jgi:hypothetical protein